MLDELDRRLLELLQGDGRLSYRALAEVVGVSVPTVSARIKRMEDLGIILGYSVKLDPARFGGTSHVDLTAEVAVQCHTCKQETSSPIIANIGGKRHPFCCPMCKRDYERRYAAMAEGL